MDSFYVLHLANPTTLSMSTEVSITVRIIRSRNADIVVVFSDQAHSITIRKMVQFFLGRRRWAKTSFRNMFNISPHVTLSHKSSESPSHDSDAGGICNSNMLVEECP
jgi:hypothetical protein